MRSASKIVFQSVQATPLYHVLGSRSCELAKFVSNTVILRQDRMLLGGLVEEYQRREPSFGILDPVRAGAASGLSLSDQVMR